MNMKSEVVVSCVSLLPLELAIDAIDVCICNYISGTYLALNMDRSMSFTLLSV